jgi:hypothetical protein
LSTAIAFVIRTVVVTILLSGMAVTLAACPEKGEGSSVHDSPDNRAPSDHTHGMGMGMGM